MSISPRLKHIANLVTKGNIAADIGTDHGYVPVYLVREGISPFAFAMDLSPGSLAKAIELVKKTGLEGNIECRLSDGLDKLSPFEADTVIISGMGGLLMTRILSGNPETLSTVKELILSPHRDADLVRDFIEANKFYIVTDEIFEDKKRQYVIIKAARNYE